MSFSPITEALRKVGLGDQLNKKPNQMSGGQMQRVAIARALVNDPDILLADEPTGALDSETSVQIMDILKEISKDKLIIMVTHNPELALSYASRVIKLKDGLIVDDSAPYSSEGEERHEQAKTEKTSMGFFTALALSTNNLMTKKARTILTAFAGSIGIIGIALPHYHTGRSCGHDEHDDLHDGRSGRGGGEPARARRRVFQHRHV